MRCSELQLKTTGMWLRTSSVTSLSRAGFVIVIRFLMNAFPSHGEGVGGSFLNFLEVPVRFGVRTMTLWFRRVCMGIFFFGQMSPPPELLTSGCDCSSSERSSISGRMTVTLAHQFLLWKLILTDQNQCLFPLVGRQDFRRKGIWLANNLERKHSHIWPNWW